MKQAKFDTLKYVNKLEVLGIPREQAQGQVELLAEAFDENMATKEDIAALKSDISIDFANVDVKFANVDARFADLKSDMNAKFAKIDVKFADLKGEMDVRFARVDTRLVEMKTELSEFKTTMKWLFGIALGISATQAGLMFSMMKFLH